LIVFVLPKLSLPQHPQLVDLSHPGSPETRTQRYRRNLMSRQKNYTKA